MVAAPGASSALVGDGTVQRIGKYCTIAKLGHGGMADVFLSVAQGPSGFNKLVVLKALRTNLAADPDFIAMFLDEARLSAQLSHPNVVQTIEVVTEGAAPVIAMEYLDGVSLSHLRRRAQRTSTWCTDFYLRALIDALGGLHHAHELCDYRGEPLFLVHRDFTPNNIFITFDGHVKVLDFGIAKAASGLSHTREGLFKGTVRYMAPEAINGRPIDRRADVYAAGVMLWEAIAGRRMWNDLPDVGVMRQVFDGQIPSLDEAAPHAPQNLRNICMRALAADPNDRYPTALEMQLDLEAAAAEQPTAAGTRELSALMNDLFSDRRAQVRATIEQQLTRLQRGASELQRGASESAPPLAMANLPEMSNVGSWMSQFAAAPRDASRVGARKTWWRMAAAGGLLAIAGLVGWSWAQRPTLSDELKSGPVNATAQSGNASSARAPAAPQNVAGTTGAAQRNSVKLKIDAAPAHAIISVDGEALGTNPAVLEHTRDGSVKKVAVRARGFLPRFAEVVMDKDSELSLRLRPASRRRNARPEPPENEANPKETEVTSPGPRAGRKTTEGAPRRILTKSPWAEPQAAPPIVDTSPWKR